MTWKRLPVLMVLSLLAGLATYGQSESAASAEAPGPAPDAPKELPGLNTPGVSSAAVDLGTYVIGPNDVLYVNVFRDKDWTGLYTVRPDGMITVPLFGDMKAQGLTPLQLRSQLTEALKEKLKDPEVSVTVYDVRSKKYSVTGNVKRPGAFPLIKRTTVFEAINDAGGFLDSFANQKDILIIRGDTLRFHFNYKDYIKGKNTDKNIPLENGDVVSVK